MSRIAELHALILTLSQGEKRHYRRLTQALGKPSGSQQSQLFDFLLTEVDGGPRVPSSTFSHQHLATLIPRLNRQLLKSLVHLKTDQSVDAKLYQALSEIKILYDKHLHAQGMRVVKQAKKLSQAYSRANLTLEIIKWEHLFQQNQKDLTSWQSTSFLREEEQKYSQLLQLQFTLRNLQSEIRIIARQNLTQQEGEVERLQKSYWQPVLFQTAEQSADPLARLYAANIQGIYHIILQQYELAYEAYLPTMDFWKEHPGWMEDQAEQLLMMFNNFFLSAMLSNEDMAPVESLMTQIRAFKFRDPVLAFRFQRILYAKDFVYCMNYARFERGTQLAKHLEIWLPQAKTRLSTSQWLMFHQNLAVFYFVSGNLSASLQSLLTLRRIPYTSIRKDIQEYARILHIILLYEMGSLDQIDASIRSAKRYFRSQLPGEHFHIKTLEALEGLFAASPGKQQKEAFHHLLSITQTAEPYLGKEEFSLWAKAHLTSQSLKDAFSARVKEVES